MSTNGFASMVVKWTHYEFVVNHNEHFYHQQLSEKNIIDLQKKSPNALDQKIWKESEKQGLTILLGNGNYLEVVLK